MSMINGSNSNLAKQLILWEEFVSHESKFSLLASLYYAACFDNLLFIAYETTALVSDKTDYSTESKPNNTDKENEKCPLQIFSAQI